MRVIKKEKVYIVLLFLLLIAFFQYSITKIVGFSLFPDEFGYWASAANVIGWDWSETASLGSYYSYGYSLILFPLLLFSKDSVMAYRSAIAVNMLLMGLSFFLLLGIKQKVYGKEDGLRDVLLGIAAVFYPSWIFYMQMTMTEALLMSVFVILVFIYVNFLEKKSMLYAVFFAAVSGYLYTVHMRSVGILIAGCIVMGVMAVCRREYRKSVLVFVTTILIAGVVILLFKNSVLQSVYSHADSSVIAVNDYAGRLWIFKELLTWEGIKDLLVSLLGKVFYLGCASMGLFYPAMYWLFKQTFFLFHKIFHKHQAEIKNAEWFGFFVFLCVFLEILISAMGMYRPTYIDGLIYGRYSEFVMPLLIMIGIIQVSESRHLFAKWGMTVLLTGLSVPVLLYEIRVCGMERIRGYHAAGMSYMLKEEYGEAVPYLIKSWLFFIFLMFIVIVMIQISRSVKNLGWLLCVIGLLEFGLGMHVSNHYVYSSNAANYMDLVITDKICENYKEGESIVFIQDERYPYVDFLQMQLREKSLHVIEAEEADDLAEQIDYLILYRDMETAYDYNDYFNECMYSNQYILYFHSKEEGAEHEINYSDSML